MIDAFGAIQGRAKVLAAQGAQGKYKESFICCVQLPDGTFGLLGDDHFSGKFM